MQLQVKIFGNDLRHWDESSIYLLDGGDEAGSDWLTEHLPEDCIRWGSAYVVEHRFVDDIVQGFEDEGGEVNILL